MFSHILRLHAATHWQALDPEMAAKHKGMKKTPQTQLSDSKPQSTRITLMLRQIQASVPGAGGKSPTYREMAEWTGIPEGTLRDWFNDSGQPTAECLLRLLERMPEGVRLRILDEFTRQWPTLEHSRLAGDRTLISRLKTILGQPKGFTYIQGDNDERRTFLIAALGHSFLNLTQPPRRVLGLDVHAADWFVPVPGVDYLGNIFEPDRLRREAQRAWPQIRHGENSLVLLNGVWGALLEFHGQNRRHPPPFARKQRH
jgi:hypothetical protein